MGPALPVALRCEVQGSRPVLGVFVGGNFGKALLCDDVYGTAAAHPVFRGGGMVEYFQMPSDAYFQIFKSSDPEWP